MFTKFFTISALAALAVATPTRGGGGSISANQCNTGDLQCCQQTQQATDSQAQATIGLLGIVLQDLNVLVGLSCSPITVIGGGNGGCNAKPVCCNNNSNGGLISIGCVPVSL